MNDIDRHIKINGIKKGVFLGVIITALSIISYYFVISGNQSPVLFVAAPVFFSIFLPIFAVVFFCFDSRKKIGGYWTFKQATTGIFIMFLVAYIFQFAVRDVAFNRFIEPNSVQKTQAAAISAKASIMKQRHASQKEIEASTNEMKKDFASQQQATIGSSITGVVISVLFVFILSLIFGSLFKKDPPEYVKTV